MIPIHRTDLLPAFDEWRDGVVSSIGNLSGLADVSWEIVGGIQCFPGSKLSDDSIVVPEDWLPMGPQRRLSYRVINLPVVDQQGLDKIASARWDESLRRSVLALWLPRMTDTGLRSYAPSSWLSAARQIIKAAQWQLKERPHLEGTLWAHLTTADFVAMQEEIWTNQTGRRRFGEILRSLAAAGERRLLADAPLLSGIRPETAPDEQVLERSLKGNAPERATKVEERSFKPFSDEFVTQVLWRARWLQENLAEQLLDCWEEQRRIVARYAQRNITSANPMVIEARRAALSKIEWRDAAGRTIDRLPFKILQRESLNFQLTDSWPPMTGRTVGILVGTIQALNICLVAFCTGARASEIGSATDASLIFEPGAGSRLQAKTFKLIDAVGGRFRDWPLHPVAARALSIQAELARRIRPENASHLWVTHAQGSEPAGSQILNLTEVIVACIKNLGLTELAGDDRAHAHRWRHTVGRIVALSVVDSPQVLLDLFGHRDLEMTLRYMLSHPEIAEDAQKVARETVIAIAEEAVVETLNSTASGQAAVTLSKGLDDLRMRRGEEFFGTESLRELTDVLTFGGKQWQIVQPGVLCTKAPGQYGPCTQGKGVPDPGSCRTTCDHRLETARAKAQCSAAVEALIAELDAAVARDEPMVVANLQGQLVAQLERWDDTREYWLARSQSAQKLWQARRS